MPVYALAYPHRRLDMHRSVQVLCGDDARRFARKLHRKSVRKKPRHAQARAVYRDAIAERGAVPRAQSQLIAAKGRNLRDLSDQSVEHRLAFGIFT